VVIRLSPEARKQLAEQRVPGTEAPTQDTAVVGPPDPAEDPSPTEKKSDDKKVPANKELTPDQKDVVQKLQTRDTQVRAHEAAHMAAAGGSGGGASYSYQTGPDGRRYAVGGEVPVQISSGRTPDETIQNAQTVRAAALAPADPSSQDLAVAAQASQMEAQARQQKSAELREKGASNDNAPDGGQTPAASDPGHDSLMVFSAIKAERPTSSASLGHLHSDSNCGFCRGAAAKYA
jgi:hypothetical protein